MKKLLFTIMCFALWVPIVSAKDIYIAQNAAGAASGADCADALAWSAFGSSSNWAPGNTLHICGTYNVPVNGVGITVLGDGSSGNPITIFFEPGAVITSPAMSQGININNHNFITVNGGPLVSGALNGTIQNTANGTGLAHQVSSPECVYNSGSNVTVEYINCHNLYVTLISDTSANDQALGIAVGNNGVITHCSFDHGDLALAGANASNVEISYNTISDTNHGITVGTSEGLVTNIKVHDNDIGGGGYVYDGAPGAYHRDALIVICEGNTNPCVTGLLIYNNYFHGVWSKESTSGMTADTFLDDYPTNAISAYVFNNISAHSAGDTGTNNAMFESGHGAGGAFNNTVSPASSANGGACIQIWNAPSVAGQNNICNGVSFSVKFWKGATAGGTIDHNGYFGGNTWYTDDSLDTSLGQFRSDCAALGGLICDADSFTTNPALNSDLTLASNSPAVGVGANLTSLCATVPQMCIGAPKTFGYNGSCGTGCVARPATGKWDLGAYPTGTATANEPNPPSGLVAVVN
jgi:hypothetical protein